MRSKSPGNRSLNTGEVAGSIYRMKVTRELHRRAATGRQYPLDKSVFRRRLKAIREKRSRSYLTLAVTVVEAKAVAQIWGSSSLTWRAPTQRKPSSNGIPQFDTMLPMNPAEHASGTLS